MKRITKTAVSASILLVLGLLLSCGGGGSGGGESSASDAMLTVALTDAASDDITSFVVDVTEIRLTHLSGAVTSILHDPLTVDLASLTDLSQVIHAGAVPPGWYTSGSITLDLSAARCVLTGQTTPATIRDAEGNVLNGTVTLPLQFGSGAFNAIAGRHRVVELDFDLDQSATVDTGANAVTLDSTFVMRVDRSDPKDLITIGTLASVNEGARTFTGEVRRLGGVRIATVTFASGDATVFQIDGAPSQGAAGLAALAAMPVGTWIQTYGTINTQALRIDVLYVEAGTGTYNGGTDIVEGHITGRTGAAGANAVLTVLGHSNNAAHDAFQFNTSFTVNTNFANTKVVARGGANAYTTDQLNIGQQVRIFGALAGTTMNAATASSVVRLQPTRILGLATGAPAAGVLTIDVSRVDLRLQNAFTWGQGGTTPPDPDALTVYAGSLTNGLGIAGGTAVEATGFFTRIDIDTVDFVATSVTNRDLAPSFLRLRDLPGGLTVVPTYSASQIQFSIAGAAVAGEAAVIDKGFVGVTALPAAPTPTVTEAPTGPTLYAIRDAVTGAVRLYVDFEAFSAALSADIESGRTLGGFGAVGTYTAVTNTLSASLAVANIR